MSADSNVRTQEGDGEMGYTMSHQRRSGNLFVAYGHSCLH